MGSFGGAAGSSVLPVPNLANGLEVTSLLVDSEGRSSTQVVPVARRSSHTTNLVVIDQLHLQIKIKPSRV